MKGETATEEDKLNYSRVTSIQANSCKNNHFFILINIEHGGEGGRDKTDTQRDRDSERQTQRETGREIDTDTQRQTEWGERETNRER